MIDMVFAPVDPTIREKVISAYLAGHGRNQIDRELRGQGIKVSQGSISNINAFKRKLEQSLSPPEQQASSGLPSGSNNKYSRYLHSDSYEYR